MRAIAILAALAALGTPLAAAEDGKPAEKSEAIKVKPEADKPAHTGVRQQQGRVLTDNDWNSTQTKKLKGVRKYPNLTLKRGIISREAVLRQRGALAPLKRRVATAGMNPGEAAYVKALQDWAAAEDRRLAELERLRSAYERLKAERDDAAERGADTSRLDLRLASLERRITELSAMSRLQMKKLQETTEHAERSNRAMSAITKSMHEIAKSIIQNMKA